MGQKSNSAIFVSLTVVTIVWAVNGIYLAALSRYSAALFWSADVIQWVVIPVSLVWYLAVKHDVRPRQYGFDLSHLGFRVCALGGLTALTFYPAFFWVRNYAWTLLGQPSGVFSLGSVFPDGALWYAVWIYSAITAGVVESIFFIGLAWLLWSRRRIGSAPLFACVSSVVFAGVHWEQGLHVVAGALVFNLVACAWFFRLRTLWPVAIGHAIIDLFALG
jgi:hypothetical protein